MKEILVCDLGRSVYKDAWDIQQAVFALRSQHRMQDILLFTEHESVYTLGKAADDNHVLADSEELKEKQIDIYHIDRGGDVTYHGPGQIVGYPILNLSGYYEDIHRYLRDLEEVMIRTLAGYGIASQRSSGYTGVWVGDEKIAAVGVKVSRWITMHGFAFNVNTDLTYFDRIIPCGIFHRGVTSMQKILGKELNLAEVRQQLIANFKEIFSVETHNVSRNEIMTLLQHPGVEVV